MAVKHLNFAGKSAVGQRQRPQATKVLAKKVAKVAAAPKQKATFKNATLKNAVAGIAKGSATASAKASGRIAGEAYKSGGGYKSNPTYGKGLGVSTPATKKIGKVKGH